MAKLHLPALSAELNVTTEDLAEVSDVRLKALAKVGAILRRST